jgi:hypothetical protein
MLISGNVCPPKKNRYLKAWDIEDASKVFLLWGTFQQVDCLTSLDAYTAAAILTRTPEALRKDLLGMLEPFVAANIVQVRALGPFLLLLLLSLPVVQFEACLTLCADGRRTAAPATYEPDVLTQPRP